MIKKINLKDAVSMLDKDEYLTTEYNLKGFGDYDYVKNANYYLIGNDLYDVKAVENILSKTHLDDYFKKFDTEDELLEEVLDVIRTNKINDTKAYFSNYNLQCAFEIEPVLTFLNPDVLGDDVEDIEYLKNDTEVLKNMAS